MEHCTKGFRSTPETCQPWAHPHCGATATCPPQGPPAAGGVTLAGMPLCPPTLPPLLTPRLLWARSCGGAQVLAALQLRFTASGAIVASPDWGGCPVALQQLRATPSQRGRARHSFVCIDDP